jgi:hypothetical protein
LIGKGEEFWDHMIMLGGKSAAIDYALAEPLRLYTEPTIAPSLDCFPISIDPHRSGHVVSLISRLTWMRSDALMMGPLRNGLRFPAAASYQGKRAQSFAMDAG